jgi:hypothetical protein
VHLPRHIISASNPSLTGRSHAPLYVLSPPSGESSTVAPPSPSRLLKNSGCDSVLKGRGFQPRRKCHKINSGLSRRVSIRSSKRVFQQPAGRGGRLFADTCHCAVSELPAKDSIPLIRAASLGRSYLDPSTSKQLLFTQASTSVRETPLGAQQTIENGVDGVQLESGRRLTGKSLKAAGGTLSLPPRLAARTSLGSSPRAT